MRARLRDSVSGRYRADENILLTKHVVAAGRFVWDPGSTPGASTICSEPTDVGPEKSLVMRGRNCSHNAIVKKVGTVTGPGP